MVKLQMENRTIGLPLLQTGILGAKLMRMA